MISERSGALRSLRRLNRIREGCKATAVAKTVSFSPVRGLRDRMTKKAIAIATTASSGHRQTVFNKIGRTAMTDDFDWKYNPYYRDIFPRTDPFFAQRVGHSPELTHIRFGRDALPAEREGSHLSPSFLLSAGRKIPEIVTSESLSRLIGGI